MKQDVTHPAGSICHPSIRLHTPRSGRVTGTLSSATRWVPVWALVLASLIASTAQAACTGVVAGRLGLLQLAGGVPEGGVSITFLGHSSFLIESPAGVRIG